MEAGKTVVTFVKYSERMYLESFQRGEMYCNDIQCFAKADERNGIGDIHEDVYKISFGKGAPIDLTKDHDSNIQMLRYPDGTYKSLFRRNNAFINYFCLYSVFGDTDFKGQTQLLLSKEMRAYGHMLLILRPGEFLKRVDDALKRAEVIEPKWGLIKYTDIDKTGGMKSYFEKPKRYSYQNEYRIGFRNTSIKKETISIGDISDISAIHTIDEVKTLRVFRDQEDIWKHTHQISERHYSECQATKDHYFKLKKELNGKSDFQSQAALSIAFKNIVDTEGAYVEFFNSILFEK